VALEGLDAFEQRIKMKNPKKNLKELKLRFRNHENKLK
jgi:hypothetical protein